MFTRLNRIKHFFSMKNSLDHCNFLFVQYFIKKIKKVYKSGFCYMHFSVRYLLRIENPILINKTKLKIKLYCEK